MRQTRVCLPGRKTDPRLPQGGEGPRADTPSEPIPVVCMCTRRYMRSLIQVCAFAAAVACACYLNCPGCNFVFDDQFAIVSNADVQPGAAFGPLWWHDFWGKPLHLHDSHKSYRPLTTASYRLHTWWSRSAPDPTVFHAANAVLHAAVSAGVAWLAAVSWAGSKRSRLRRALMCSVWFACHPIHVEAVTGTVGRAELLCALACIGGYACHRMASAGPDTSASQRTFGCIGMLLFIAVALLTKETGIALIGILCAQELILVLPARGGAVGVGCRVVLLLACAVVYMILRVVIMSPPGGPLSIRAASLADSQLIRRAENPLLFLESRSSWYLSVAYIQAFYVRMLLVPTSLCIEYSFDCIPMVESLADPRNLFSIILFGIGITFAVSLLRRIHHHNVRATMGMSAWLLFPWFLVSHVLLRIGTLVAERTMYLPSIGALLLLCHLICPPPNTGGAVPIGVGVAYLSASCLRRTLDWRTDEAAFESALQVCPRSAKLQQQMCTLRTNQAKFEQALLHCDAAFAIDPEFCETQSSYAFAYFGLHDIGRAVHYFNASLPCVFSNVKSYKSLLTLYDFLFNHEPQNATLYEQMGSSQALIGNRLAAMSFFREAASLYLQAARPEAALAALQFAETVSQSPRASEPAEDSSEGAAVLELGCVLSYWKGMALQLAHAQKAGSVRREQLPESHSQALIVEAFAHFSEVRSCPGTQFQNTRLAAAAELRQLGQRTENNPRSRTHRSVSMNSPRRVLLLSFHSGVEASVRWVADELGWQLEAPRVGEFFSGCNELSSQTAEDRSAYGVQLNAQYEMSSERASCLWRNERVQESLERFAMVIVADTTALARPMLQHDWPSSQSNTRLLLWVCNRFDYGVVGDSHYYHLIKGLQTQPRVSLVSSTPFEWQYARDVRRTPFPSPAVIRPIGLMASSTEWHDPTPVNLEKQRSFFLMPKINEARLKLHDALTKHRVPFWTPGEWPDGMQSWGGPMGVRNFKAVIHIPYAPTTFALFEHAQAAELKSQLSQGL